MDNDPRDYLVVDYVRSPQEDYNFTPPNTNVHSGQVKLFVSSLFFLTNYWDGKPGVVVYAGAAPSHNTMILAKLFPALEWHLYDTNPISVPKELSSRVKYFRQYFTTEQATQYSTRSNVYFMSDIRGSLAGNKSMYDNDVIVAKDMYTQMDWVLLMKPTAAMLKFRMPFFAAATNEVIAAATPINYQTNPELPSNHFRYLSGILTRQAYPHDFSTECRLMIKGKDYSLYDYNIRTHDGVANYFNKYIRPKQFPHPVTGAINQDLIPKVLYNSFDGWFLLYATQQYYVRCGVTPTEDQVNKLAMKCVDDIFDRYSDCKPGQTISCLYDLQQQRIDKIKN